MNETVLGVVSDIMNSFDMPELYELFREQIENPEEFYTGPVIDHFQPLYRNYKMLDDIEDDDADDIRDARERFYEICIMIINMITKKFDIDIDPEYLNDSRKDVPGICLALYSFFVLDFYNNIYEILKNYLVRNIFSIYDTFKENIDNKDCVTMSNKKYFSPEMSVIASNIYDITDYIFTLLDAESALEYLDEGYIPCTILNHLYFYNYIDGNFVRTLADIYRDNTALKSKVCFNILYKIKDHTIDDVFELLKENDDILAENNDEPEKKKTKRRKKSE
jgi:hypothetical protein